MVPQGAYVHLYSGAPHLSPSNIPCPDGQCGTPRDCRSGGPWWSPCYGWHALPFSHTRSRDQSRHTPGICSGCRRWRNCRHHKPHQHAADLSAAEVGPGWSSGAAHLCQHLPPSALLVRHQWQAVAKVDIVEHKTKVAGCRNSVVSLALDKKQMILYIQNYLYS